MLGVKLTFFLTGICLTLAIQDINQNTVILA